MKKLLVCLQSLFVSAFMYGQITISEIMYNPPEAGVDQLEYIEFFNNSNNSISLKDYSIQDAVIMNFPDTFISPRGYFIIAVNPERFDSVFGFRPLAWTSGALRNDTEIITLLDQNAAVVDSVRYSDTNGWPTSPDGEGRSLELCRIDADNGNSLYWKASNRNTGIQIEGKILFASPGQLNTVPCAEATVQVSNFQFNPSNVEIFEGESVEWTNISGSHNVNGNTSSFPGNPESFGSGAPSSSNWKYLKRFTKIGTYNYQCDVHPSMMKGIVTVKLKSNQYPNYPVGLIRTVNSDGVADSLNISCAVDGIVYGINLRPTGLQFTVIDQFNDGIAVFSGNTNFGYSVKEGDLVTVRGIVDQFNGLIQIVPDTIIKISSNNTLVNPTVVVALNEQSESQLVRIRNVQLVNPVAWTKNPNGFTVKVTDGFGTFDLRIDNDVDLVSKAAPTGKFDVTGIGSQFDVSEPYLEGYQILPRYVADINPYNPGGGTNYSRYAISKVSTSNSNGVADSIGIACELKGIVHGVDLQEGLGVLFTIIDATGGIAVFNADENFGYLVKEGDDISVKGRIDQFRGLTQIVADTIIKNSAANPLATSRIVSLLDEGTESELIEMRSMTITNPSEWKGDGTSFNVTISNGINNFILRVDKNTETSILSYKGNKINVRGIGSQFDNSEPFTSDYQIIPRYNADITWLTDTKNEGISESVVFYPNPFRHEFSIRTDEKFDWIEIFNQDGKRVYKNEFSNSILFPHQSGIFYVKLVGNKTVVAKIIGY